MTIWKDRTGDQSDRGFLTNETGNVLADNTGNKLVFHTGVFVKAKTNWKDAR